MNINNTREFPETLCSRNRSMIRLVLTIENDGNQERNIETFLDRHPVYLQFERESFVRAFETAHDYLYERGKAFVSYLIYLAS